MRRLTNGAPHPECRAPSAPHTRRRRRHQRHHRHRRRRRHRRRAGHQRRNGHTCPPSAPSAAPRSPPAAAPPWACCRGRWARHRRTQTPPLTPARKRWEAMGSDGKRWEAMVRHQPNDSHVARMTRTELSRQSACTRRPACNPQSGPLCRQVSPQSGENQRHSGKSEAIRGTQKHSEALRGTQKHSEALRSHRALTSMRMPIEHPSPTRPLSRVPPGLLPRPGLPSARGGARGGGSGSSCSCGGCCRCCCGGGACESPRDST